MKKSNLFYSLVVLLSATIIFSACGNKNNNEPSASEKQLTHLTGDFKTSSSTTWNVSQVLYEGTEDRTADWTGFQLTLSTDGNSNNSYSASGVPPANTYGNTPWPNSGSWSFGGTADAPNINQIIRDDNLEIAISFNNDETQLTMSFFFDPLIHNGSGRIEAVEGEYVFVFTK